MQARRFGHTGHLSTVAIFGAAAFWQVTQAQADATMQLVIDHGINHIDVAPSYGLAEERLGPWLARERNRFFVGCKTMERSQAGAAAEFRKERGSAGPSWRSASRPRATGVAASPSPGE